MTKQYVARTISVACWILAECGCFSACSIHERSLDTDADGKDSNGGAAQAGGASPQPTGKGGIAGDQGSGGATPITTFSMMEGTAAGQGGTSGAPGSSPAAGGIETATGGTSAAQVGTGGAAQPPTSTMGDGGSVAGGGAPANVGTSPSAGVAGNGGTSSVVSNSISPTGGVTTTGGSTLAGGATTSGGAAPSGGASPTGGVSTTGGATNVCRIGQNVYASDKINDANACQSCQPSKNPTDWTTLDEGAGCGKAAYCHAGTCQAGCWIGGFYAASTISKANSCVSCQPEKTTADWSRLPDTTSCETNKFCVAGACKPGCVIESVFSASGDSHPTAACLTCSPAQSNVKWSRRDGCFKSLAVGGSHACALVDNGSVWCWGLNDRGQLGDRSSINSPSPVAVSGLKTATVIAAGANHTCALLSDGHVQCWGSNEFGQIGDNSSNAKVLAPSAVLNVDSVAGVAGGYGHSCAVLSSNTVLCWGRNDYGQLGRGGTVNSPVAVAVSGLRDVLAISTGDFHTCGVLSTGGIKCWGNNSVGQLGTSDNANRDTPADVQDLDLTTAQAVSAGSTHTCALLSDGRVKCWGSNGVGELGNSTKIGSNTPVFVKDLNTAVAIATGTNVSCARLKEGSVKCWGSDVAGGLGNGTDGASAVPVPVSNVTAASTVGLGINYGCVALTAGGVQCWGYNRYGQLGNPGSNYESKNAPVDVFGF